MNILKKKRRRRAERSGLQCEQSISQRNPGATKVLFPIQKVIPPTRHFPLFLGIHILSECVALGLQHCWGAADTADLLGLGLSASSSLGALFQSLILKYVSWRTLIQRHTHILTLSHICTHTNHSKIVCLFVYLTLFCSVVVCFSLCVLLQMQQLHPRLLPLSSF